MFCLALVAAVEPTAVGEPGHSALDRPAMAAQPCRGFDALACNAVGDAAFTQPSPQVVIVVALVGVQLGGLASAWAAAGAYRRDPADQRLQGWLSWRLAPDMPTEMGKPVRSVIRWIFEPFLPRSTGFGPVRSPLSGPACSPSRLHTSTSPGLRERRVRPAPGGAVWPRPAPCSIR